ncbi:M23 family metallopeptidase [Synechococcus sp. CS-205]|uniref:M23 family metallopeptidase n=1 Tax=Synechococcus sp. CS-205 TaxID=2847984 RepID=UPI0037DA6FE3
MASTPLGLAQLQPPSELGVPAEPPVPAAPPQSPPPRALASPRLANDTPAPLKPSFDQVPQARPRRFDQSLDDLVRQGVVTPAERNRVESAGALQPGELPAHRQACSSGALSEQECRTGVSVRWRGRNPLAAERLVNGQPSGALMAGMGRLGSNGLPLPPITVPVSALLSGAGGSFRLSDVFRVTPRPAPLAGNGNRRLLFPLIGSAVTTSSFGWRLHPVLGSWLMHAGKDLAAPEGTPVVAALSGRVVSSGVAGGYGLAVEIEHTNPLRRTLYGHLSELYVKEGELVKQGTVVGRVGSTGLSTGPHLHFELRLPDSGGWVAIDPGMLDPGGTALGGPDAIALLMGQLLQSLERPAVPAAG